MQSAFSQKDSISKYTVFRNDTLRAGNEFYFYINPDIIINGIYLGIVEENIIVFKDNLTLEIDTSKINKIVSLKDYLIQENKSESTKRTFLYVGAGYLISVPVSSHKYSNGLDITVKWLYLLSQKRALRIDFDYFELNREKYSITSTDFAGVTRITEYLGGDAKAYLFKINYLTGEMNPEKPTMYYGMLGAGFGSSKIYEIKNTRIKSSTVPDSPTEYEKFTSVCFGFSAGLGGNLKITSGIRTFAEFQYNLWFTGSGGPSGFVTAKLGLVL